MSTRDRAEQIARYIEGSEVYTITEMHSVQAHGMTLRVEVLEQDREGAPYRYFVRVKNETTGSWSYHGNGGATPEEALDVFHWNEVAPAPEEG